MKHSFLLAYCVCVRVCVAVFVWVCHADFGRLPIVCMLSLDDHLCMNSCDSLFYGYLVFLNWFVCYKTKYCWVIASNQFSFRSFIHGNVFRSMLFYLSFTSKRCVIVLSFFSLRCSIDYECNSLEYGIQCYLLFRNCCVCVQSLEMLQAYAFMPMLKI